MIGRRRFTLGLGSIALTPLLAAAAARADVRVNGMVLPEKNDKRKLRDIPYVPLENIPNHRQLMRDIVVELAAYGRRRKSDFIVLLRNAPELLIKEKRESDWEGDRDPDGSAAGKYTPMGSIIRPCLEAIDGMVIDGLFYGRDHADQPTDAAVTRYLMNAVDMLESQGRRVLTIEYCRDAKLRAQAARQLSRAKTVSYFDAEKDKALAVIPKERPQHENAQHVTDMSLARNFLPMMHSQSFGSRSDWVAALAATNYDVLLLDPFWRGTEPLTSSEVKSLKYKELGARRLVLANLPVGRAADTRFYWKREWTIGNPSWLVAPDPLNPGETVVQYWNPEWKALVGKYMQGLVDLGFDGIMVDSADAYLYFEDLMPL